MKMDDARRSGRYHYEDGEWWYHRPKGGRTRAATGKCERCGDEFVTRKSTGQAKATRPYRFCSQKCYNETQREAAMMECEHCGEVFHRVGTAQRFCSQRCHGAARRGAANYNFKGYTYLNHGYPTYTPNHPRHPTQRVHAVVFARAHGYEDCNECGVAKVEHIHHRDRDKLNSAPENLEGLCANCHHARHAQENREAFAWLHAYRHLTEALAEEGVEEEEARWAAHATVHDVSQVAA